MPTRMLEVCNCREIDDAETMGGRAIRWYSTQSRPCRRGVRVFDRLVGV